MILFPPLRTKRISVVLTEATLNQSIAVCRLPAEHPEATTTAFLRFVAAAAKAPAPGYVTDPRLWTVEERARLVCHYLSQVHEDGSDFSVVGGSSAGGKLSDYLRFDADLRVTEVKLGEVAGKARVMRPLLGVHVETLEKFCANRGDWLHGMIACQIQAADEKEPDYLQLTDLELIEWCTSRFNALREMPESAFEEVYAAWVRGRAELEHFFATAVDDAGIVFLPQELTEAGPKDPARFPAVSCLSESTRDLFAGPV